MSDAACATHGHLTCLLDDAPISGAFLYGPFRYTLWRVWDRSLPPFVVIGLNPSTADETKDDPTIRRCISFAKREGAGRLVMLNLFAFRATDPQVMFRAPDPFGPMNSVVLRDVCDEAVARAGKVVAAWGAHGSKGGKSILRSIDAPMLCFGRTQQGQPRHPLYLRGDTPLELF